MAKQKKKFPLLNLKPHLGGPSNSNVLKNKANVQATRMEGKDAEKKVKAEKSEKEEKVETLQPQETELSRSKKLLLKQMLGPNQPVPLLKERLSAGGDGSHPRGSLMNFTIFKPMDKDLPLSMIPPVPKNVIDDLTKKPPSFYMEGEENVKDIKDAIVDKKSKIQCPDVTFIDEERYNKLYKNDPALLSKIQPQAIIQERIYPADNETDDEYDLDSDDETWLDEKKAQGSGISTFLFEDIIAKLNKLNVNKFNDEALVIAKSSYPFNVLQEDVELFAVFQYWKKKIQKKGALAWNPTIKRPEPQDPLSGSPRKANNTLPDAYTVFRDCKPLEGRVLRSHKEVIGFKKAKELLERAANVEKVLRGFQEEIRRHQFSDTRSRILQGLDYLNSSTKPTKETVSSKVPMINAKDIKVEVNSQPNSPQQLKNDSQSFESSEITNRSSDGNEVKRRRSLRLLGSPPERLMLNDSSSQLSQFSPLFSPGPEIESKKEAPSPDNCSPVGFLSINGLSPVKGENAEFYKLTSRALAAIQKNKRLSPRIRLSRCDEESSSAPVPPPLPKLKKNKQNNSRSGRPSSDGVKIPDIDSQGDEPLLSRLRSALRNSANSLDNLKSHSQ